VKFAASDTFLFVQPAWVLTDPLGSLFMVPTFFSLWDVEGPGIRTLHLLLTLNKGAFVPLNGYYQRFPYIPDFNSSVIVFVFRVR